MSSAGGRSLIRDVTGDVHVSLDGILLSSRLRCDSELILVLRNLPVDAVLDVFGAPPPANAMHISKSRR
jgi:hypothetical protein